MLAHVMDPMLAAMGDKQAADRPGPFRNPVLRYLIIYLLPWPKGAPTAPEFLTGDEPDLEKGVKKLRNVVERFAAQVSAGRAMAPHPAFGKLSAQDWGALQHRHLEHHLKQFGL
jgi:hypothetical protein